MPIDDFVREGDATASHPLLRFLGSKMRNGHRAVFRLEVPARLVGYAKAKIYLRLLEGDEEVDLKCDDWDDDLNDGLIRLGIRAETAENEQERFALALRDSLKRPENRYGDGYFNSVLVDFIQQSDLHAHPAIAAVLEHLPHLSPHVGQSYYDCREMIEHAIRTRGLELTKHLGYPVPDAVDILAGALARYLDERFSVTNRRLLGLL